MSVVETVPPSRKPWSVPEVRRIEGGSAEFGSGMGADGSGFS